MNAILRSHWNSLLEVKGAPCASLYVAFDPVGHEGMGDSLRLRKLLDKAEQQLQERGYDKRAVKEVLTPAHEFPSTPEWANRARAMAILLGPSTAQFLPLPRPVMEETWGDDHLHLRPLLPLVVESDRFYLLALSENRAQLYAGNSEGLSLVNVPGLPKNLDEAVPIDSADRGSQTHSANAGGLGRRGALFHGHGGMADTAKISRHEYFQRVYAAISPVIAQDPGPLVLATVSEGVADWQSVARGLQTLPEVVTGNPDYAAVDDLHERAWKILAESMKGERESAYARLSNAKGTPLAILGLSQVLPAAIAGRVDTLFLDCRTPICGKFDRTSGEVIVQHSTGENRQTDLLEEALRETSLHGGKVFALDSEGDLPVACEALLRY